MCCAGGAGVQPDLVNAETDASDIKGIDQVDAVATCPNKRVQDCM